MLSYPKGSQSFIKGPTVKHASVTQLRHQNQGKRERFGGLVRQLRHSFRFAEGSTNLSPLRRANSAAKAEEAPATDKNRPELLHPFASAIDSPPGIDYVRLPEGARKVYQRYGAHSIEGWHKKHKKYVD
ncbi:hypothetical protein F5I97DRAFT_1414639 [Phlebopus sp. FC_14]|nr:hypothetical protein F5I97DRAFT_1414639 [Phlebopus sp. FC_14]